MQDILKNVDAPKGIFADAMPVATGGRMIQRTPNDPAWYKGGLWHDNMPLNVPGLWYMSWYDVSVGPNLEMFNHVRRTARRDVADQQWAIIAPVAHCAYTRATENTVVGERSMGDARLDYPGDHVRLLRSLPEGRAGRAPREAAEGDVFHDGIEQVAVVRHLAARGCAAADPVSREWREGEHGPGRWAAGPSAPAADTSGCLHLRSAESGAVGRRQCVLHRERGPGRIVRSEANEARDDVLVYTSEPFTDGIELTGPIVPTLYVSSDASDTDFTVKVLDVYPDGQAYNLDESIQRMRYRDGYDKPLAWMEKGKVYKVALQPLTTSNYFAPGHRIRIEVSSSNFPRFDRNLNTGGNNYDEAKGVVARNSVHHSKQYPSSVTFTVVRGSATSAQAARR